jgi:6-phosphogluconolactonase (cycloisomerase 2 family)
MKKETSLTITAIVLFTILNSCSKQDQYNDEAALTTQRVGNNRQGVVYTESNAATQNSIVAYLQNSNGTLSYFTTIPTGGAGTGTLLGSQGALALDETHHWLFAVNAGSNSISSFSINNDGTPVIVQTVSSNGTMPVSLSVFGNWLYVVNAGSANISGFFIGTDGKLTYIAGSNQYLSSMSASPAEIEFTMDRHLVVSEKNTNQITTFPVTTSGVAGAGSSASAPMPTPYGFAISGNNIIVAHASGGAANLSTVASYAAPSYLTNTTTASLACTPICAEQTMASRVVTTSDGSHAYVTNTGSNTISSFIVNPNGTMQTMNKIEATTGTGPADIVLSNNESFLYTINSGSHTISQYKKTPQERLNYIGEIGGLPAYATGLVAL